MNGRLWKVSDREELGGVLTGDDGVGFNYYINLLSKQNLMKQSGFPPGFNGSMRN